jgi:hypothetical protein
MTFQIDTGAPQIDITHGIPTWFQDEMPEDMPPERLMHNYAYHLIGKLGTYKSMMYARRHLVGHWPFLQRLADIHPEIFDEVMTAYAEVYALAEVPRSAAPSNHAA